MPGTRASPAPSPCFDEPPGAWLPRLHSLLDLGGGVGGGWLFAQIGRAVPASVLERKGIAEMFASSSSLGTQAFQEERGEKVALGSDPGSNSSPATY